MSDELNKLTDALYPGIGYASKKLLEQGTTFLGEAIAIAARLAKDKDDKFVGYSIPMELLPSITQALHQYLRDSIAQGRLEQILPPIEGEGTLFINWLEMRLSNGDPT